MTKSDRAVNLTVNFLEGDNMYRIITMAATTAATIVMTDYLALAVVLATMLAMSVDNVTGALLIDRTDRIPGPRHHQGSALPNMTVSRHSPQSHAFSRNVRELEQDVASLQADFEDYRTELRQVFERLLLEYRPAGNVAGYYSALPF